MPIRAAALAGRERDLVGWGLVNTEAEEGRVDRVGVAEVAAGSASVVAASPRPWPSDRERDRAAEEGRLSAAEDGRLDEPSPKADRYSDRRDTAELGRLVKALGGSLYISPNSMAEALCCRRVAAEEGRWLEERLLAETLPPARANWAEEGRDKLLMGVVRWRSLPRSSSRALPR